MPTHLYLSLIPESLVVSMLPPEEFGTYMAVGTQKRSRGQAIFFDLKPEFESDFFDLEQARERCVPHPDGEPKHSVYAGVYRVLEHVPLAAINDLWLTTQDGRVLRLERGESPQDFPQTYHLYQELCPVHPLIASRLSPPEFCTFITDRSRPVSVPRICFADMELQELADDPQRGDASNLPYSHIDHLRDCIGQLVDDPEKHTKTVNRIQPQQVCYRCAEGYYVGGGEGMAYYPMPPHKEVEREHYAWWRGACG